MKDLEKVFMVIAFLLSIGSMINGIRTDSSWFWQFNTAMWVAATFFKHILVKRYQKFIQKITNDEI